LKMGQVSIEKLQGNEKDLEFERKRNKKLKQEREGLKQEI